MHHFLIRIISGAWLGVGLIWLVTSFDTKRTVRVQSVGLRALHVLLEVLAFFLLFSTWPGVGLLESRVVPDTTLWMLLGTLLTLAGIIFAIVARFAIGKNWSSRVILKEDHELLQSGPYSVVRHPIYAGFLLAVLGTAVAFGQVHNWVAFVLALLGWKTKSLREERLMRDHFGEKYSDYSRRVKALIPLVW